MKHHVEQLIVMTEELLGGLDELPHLLEVNVPIIKQFLEDLRNLDPDTLTFEALLDLTGPAQKAVTAIHSVL